MTTSCMHDSFNILYASSNLSGNYVSCSISNGFIGGFLLLFGVRAIKGYSG